MAENQQTFTALQLGMEFFHFTALTRPFPPHFHASCLIGCLASGKRLMRINNARIIISQNDMAIIPPYASHACEAIRGLPSEWFCVHAQIDQPPQHPIILHNQSDLCATFLNLAVSAFSGAPLNAWPAFLKRIAAICRTQPNTNPPDPQPPQEHLDLQNLARKLCLTDMAQTRNMNKFQFLRHFRAQKGITPHKYLTNLRIIHSQRLLRQGLPLSACAAACGFCDQSHFSRVFKASIGLAPGAYRSSLLLATKAA